MKHVVYSKKLFAPQISFASLQIGQTTNYRQLLLVTANEFDAETVLIVDSYN
jgi:hypothetical protein